MVTVDAPVVHSAVTPSAAFSPVPISILETLSIPAPPVNVIGRTYSVISDTHTFLVSSAVFIEMFASPRAIAGTVNTSLVIVPFILRYTF